MESLASAELKCRKCGKFNGEHCTVTREGEPLDPSRCMKEIKGYYRLRPEIVIEADTPWDALNIFNRMEIERNDSVVLLICISTEDVSKEWNT